MREYTSAGGSGKVGVHQCGALYAQREGAHGIRYSKYSPKAIRRTPRLANDDDDRGIYRMLVSGSHDLRLWPEKNHLSRDHVGPEGISIGIYQVRATELFEFHVPVYSYMIDGFFFSNYGVTQGSQWIRGVWYWLRRSDPKDTNASVLCLQGDHFVRSCPNGGNSVRCWTGPEGLETPNWGPT